MNENAPSCVKNPPTLQEWRDKINEIKIVTPSGCWESHLIPYSRGYTVVVFGGSRMVAHRAAYEAFIGPIGEGLYACHKCDNRRCFNPEHIFIGTQKDNIQDAMSKKRMAHGSKNWQAKLSPEDVVKLRGFRLSGLSYEKCGKAFGIHKRTAMRILSGDGYVNEQSHLGEFKCPEYNKRSNLTAETVRAMYAMVLSGKTQSSVAKHFGVSQGTLFSAFDTPQWIREIPELANRVKRKRRPHAAP